MATPTRVPQRAAVPETALNRPSRGGPRMRAAVAVICLATVAALFASVARQSWSTTATAADVVRLEGNGAAMLHPMTTLLTELVAAQSAAVRGTEVDQESVRSALSQLQEPDALYGDDLLTTQRLADLADHVEAAFAAGETGRVAYNRYSSIVDLAVDLIRVIGDTSHLVHDPELDSYYLMDAAIVRLPHAMVYAGRAADLVAIADAEGGIAGDEPVLTGEDAVRAAVARFNVSFDAEQVSAGLSASVDFTARSELGTNIAERLDAFRAAADAFAPPTMLHELATEVQATAMADNASRVFAAAQSLAHLLLSELQALLAVRADDLAERQRFTAIATGAATVLALGILALLVLPTRRPAPSSRRDDADAGPGRELVAVNPESAATALVDAAGRSGHAR